MVMANDFGIEDYLTRSGASESSLRTYRKILTKCEADLGKPLSRATTRDLAALKTKLRGMRSGSNYTAELRRFYKAAGKPKLAELCILKRKRERLGPDDLLTLPEVNAMLGACESLRDRALIAVLWATGQRVTAVTALHLGDLMEKLSDNGGGAYRVFFRTVKIAGQEHVSWILDKEGADHVRAWTNAYPLARTEDAPVFPNFVQGTALNESAVLKLVKGIARRAGITKRVYPHLFRHSRATHLMRLGVPEAQIEKLLGWTPGSGMLAKRYGHLADQDSYHALLKAQGLPVPEREDLGKLAAAEGQLRPVVPMLPSVDAAGTDGKDATLEMWLRNPEVRRIVGELMRLSASTHVTDITVSKDGDALARVRGRDNREM